MSNSLVYSRVSVGITTNGLRLGSCAVKFRTMKMSEIAEKLCYYDTRNPDGVKSYMTE